MSTRPYAPPGSQPSGSEGAQALSGAAEQAQEKAQDLAGQAQEKAQNLAGQANQQAQHAAGQAKTRLREQLDERSSQVAGQVNQQADDLRTVSSSLRDQGKEGPAKAADKLAEYAERVGGYLSDRDSDGLLADAEDFGRRQPWAIAAGGLALGFAASRLLKASAGRRYSSRYSGQAATARGSRAGHTASGGYPDQGSYASSSGYAGATPSASSDAVAIESAVPIPPAPPAPGA